MKTLRRDALNIQERKWLEREKWHDVTDLVLEIFWRKCIGMITKTNNYQINEVANLYLKNKKHLTRKVSPFSSAVSALRFYLWDMLIEFPSQEKKYSTSPLQRSRICYRCRLHEGRACGALSLIVESLLFGRAFPLSMRQRCLQVGQHGSGLNCGMPELEQNMQWIR